MTELGHETPSGGIGRRQFIFAVTMFSALPWLVSSQRDDERKFYIKNGWILSSEDLLHDPRSDLS